MGSPQVIYLQYYHYIILQNMSVLIKTGAQFARGAHDQQKHAVELK